MARHFITLKLCKPVIMKNQDKIKPGDDRLSFEAHSLAAIWNGRWIIVLFFTIGVIAGLQYFQAQSKVYSVQLRFMPNVIFLSRMELSNLIIATDSYRKLLAIDKSTIESGHKFISISNELELDLRGTDLSTIKNQIELAVNGIETEVAELARRKYVYEALPKSSTRDVTENFSFDTKIHEVTNTKKIGQFMVGQIRSSASRDATVGGVMISLLVGLFGFLVAVFNHLRKLQK